MRPLVWLCATALAAGGAATPSGVEAELRVPAPAHGLAGVFGVQTKSDIRLYAAPDDPHELDVILAFPDRARWTLRRESALNDRLIQYRFGEHGFQVEVGARDSRAMEEAPDGSDAGERLGFLRRSALRQAAFLWPEGAHWEGEGDRREAPVFALESDGLAGERDETGAPRATALPAAIGTLVATLGPDGRPLRLSSHDAAGALEETLELVAWRAIGTRQWPAHLRLSVQGELIWDEQVREVEPTVRFADRAFLPLEHLVLLRAFAEPVRVRLPATVTRRHPLDPGTGWSAALEQAQMLHRSARAALADGLALAPESWIELGDGGAPVAVVLELAGSPAVPPTGWTAVPAADAVALELGGLAAPSEAEWDRLAAALPAGRSAERWSARIGPSEIRLQALLASPR